MIYLDNAATTPCTGDVIEAVSNCLKNNFGNPSSLHALGVNAEKTLTSTRNKIARLLKVSKEEIYFTSGGTEGNNIAIKGVCSALRKPGRIITTKAEHKSVSNVYAYMESMGFEVVYVPIDSNGIINLDYLKKALTPDTKLVSYIYVNNETGSIAPVERIQNIIKSRVPEALIHIDGVQAFGKIDIPKNIGDIITISGHKIHAPKGIGAIYIKKGTKINPVFLGGGQEKGMRSGTENVPAITGLGVAIDEIDIPKNFEYVRELNYLMRKLLAKKVSGLHINSPLNASPYILNISIKGTKSEILLHSLEQYGIYVSNGSACSSNRPAPSSVLLAMGIDRRLVEGSIRISFNPFITPKEVEYACEAIAQVSSKLQRIIKR